MDVNVESYEYILNKTKYIDHNLLWYKTIYVRISVKNFNNRKLFTNNLMYWNNTYNNRAMPWKGEKDPYKIWLSEIILQQTRVEQGLEYYNRFVKTYPTIELLAAADENAVFKLWEGLGYYSRCKNLIATARIIAFDNNNVFPINYEAILKLKGVGPYTAAAIASFAFNLPHAVVDGNVMRVLSRFFGIEVPIDSNDGKKLMTTLAQNVMDIGDPSSYNQAIMDFGATICKPQLPLCPTCLLQPYCIAYKKKLVTELPIKQKKLHKKHRYFYYIIAEYNNKIYVKKRTAKDIWQNLWEFILVEKPEKISIENFIKSDDFVNIFEENNSAIFTTIFYKQQLTHQTIEGTFIYVKCKMPLNSKLYITVNKADISTLAFPRFITNFFEKSREFKL